MLRSYSCITYFRLLIQVQYTVARFGPTTQIRMNPGYAALNVIMYSYSTITRFTRRWTWALGTSRPDA